MRRKLIILLFLLTWGIGLSLFAWRCSRTSLHQIPPSVTYIGRTPGIGYPAGFYLTNSEHGSILLMRVQVQILEAGDWRILTEKPVEISRSADHGKTNVNFSLVVEAGDYRKIAVDVPEERPWRICLSYSREANWLTDMLARGRTAWRTRRLPPWKAKIWSGPPVEIFSKEISK